MTPEKHNTFKSSVNEGFNRIKQLPDLIKEKIDQYKELEASVKNSIRRKTINNFVRILTAGTIITSTAGCVVASGEAPESGANRPVVTLTSIPTNDPEKNTDPTQVATELAPPGVTETVITPPTITPEPTATATEMSTPTKEKSLIEGNIFFDPQSKEDFKDVALAPSPIDEPEKFALWHEEYFKQINEKLENYNGPTVEITEALSNGQYGTIEYYSEKWPVVGSYLFKWHGEDVLNKTYIFKKKSDGDGYVLLNTTYYPESIANSQNYEYNYSTPKRVFVIRYCLTDYLQERWPDEFRTDFFNTYVMTEDKIDSFFRIYFNKPEEGDEELFSQMQFIAGRSR